MLQQVLSWAASLPSLVYVVVGLLTAWYIKAKTGPPKNIPPFPVRPYPFFGHIPMLGKDTLGTLKEWRRTTGDIYSIYMGQTLAVVISSYDILKEALVKNADYFNDRPHLFLDSDERFIGGIANNSGPVWKEQRNVTVAILKKFGMGKNLMGEKVNTEVKAYLDSIGKSKGEPIDIRRLTNLCVANIICTIITGKRFELDDPCFLQMFKIVDHQTKYLQGTSLLVVFSWLKYLPGDLFHAKAILDHEEILRTEFCLKFINKVKENSNTDMQQNFIHSYLAEEKERRESGKGTTLDEQNLTMILCDLFLAGTETTSTSILWSLLYAIHYPETQKKLHQEIDEKIGSKRLPNAEDKTELKYVNAFILEIQRLGSIAPLAVPHLCSRTTTFRGYTIPEGTIVLPFLYEIHHDSKNWEDPLVFRPERFFDDDGNLAVSEKYIPFSIGRRACPGETLAKLELFLFTTGIFQEFDVQPEDPDNLPSLEPDVGLTRSPKPYKIRLIPRQQS